MAEEVKREREDDSAPGDKEQTPQNVEGNEAEADTTTPGVNAIDPEDQTFWEDSVDANAVDISEGETAVSDTPPIEEPPTPAPPEDEGEDQPEEQEPVTEMEAEQEEAHTERETADSDTPPTEEPSAPAEEAQKPGGEEKEATTTHTDDADSTSPTPAPPEDEGEDQPEEQEPVAEMDAEQVEAQTEGETAASDAPPTEEPPAPAEEAQQPDGDEIEASSTQTEDADSTSPSPAPPEDEREDQPKGNVLSFYRRLNKKTLIAGSGILLLIAGSIGFTLVPGLRSSDTITSTFLGGMPETAYDMKFFLPLDVGYEKSQFVKVTIALELMDDGLQKEIDKNISQLRKEVIDLILTKSPKEVKSSSGKKELSREITSRINNYLLKDCIKNTYFTELVIL